MRVAEYILWTGVALCAYTYFGYPLLVRFLSSTFKKSVDKMSIEPVVSFVIAGYNEEKVIAEKLENTLALDYPAERLDVIFASDGSMDATVAKAAEFIDRGVTVLDYPERRGKVSAINDAVGKARGSIVVFSDSRQRFDSGAVRHLVENFHDPEVGAVSGELIITADLGGIGRSIVTYWDYEKRVRKGESEFGSVIGVTGAIWAIRKDLFEPYPPDTILDDLYLPLKVLLKNKRVVFEPGAKAYDVASMKAKDEIRRKVRTIAGNWQVFFRLKGLFNPLRNKAFVQFVSHKALRVLIPFFLAAIFLSNLWLAKESFYRSLLVCQFAFYALCLSSLLPSFRILKVFRAFAILNYSAFVGFFRYVSRTQGVTWKK